MLISNYKLCNFIKLEFDIYTLQYFCVWLFYKILDQYILYKYLFIK